MSVFPIPVIDIGGLRSQQLEERQAVALKIRQAAHTVGFFYITNHGIANQVIARIFAETKRFFNLPLVVKNRVAIAHSPISRGYELIGHQTLDTNASPDLKEGFYIGVERNADDPLVSPHYGWRTHHADVSQNLWFSG